jgi:hypothetical protein
MPGRIIKRKKKHTRLDSQGALRKTNSEIKTEQDTLKTRKTYYNLNKEIEPNHPDMKEMPSLIEKSKNRLGKLNELKERLKRRIKWQKERSLQPKLNPTQQEIVNKYGKINKENHKKIINGIQKDIEELEKRARSYRSASDIDTARDLEERIESFEEEISNIQDRYN